MTEMIRCFSSMEISLLGIDPGKNNSVTSYFLYQTLGSF